MNTPITHSLSRPTTPSFAHDLPTRHATQQATQQTTLSNVQPLHVHTMTTDAHAAFVLFNDLRNTSEGRLERPMQPFTASACLEESIPFIPNYTAQIMARAMLEYTDAADINRLPVQASDFQTNPDFVACQSGNLQPLQQRLQNNRPNFLFCVLLSPPEQKQSFHLFGKFQLENNVIRFTGMICNISQDQTSTAKQLQYKTAEHIDLRSSLANRFVEKNKKETWLFRQPDDSFTIFQPMRFKFDHGRFFTPGHITLKYFNRNGQQTHELQNAYMGENSQISITANTTRTNFLVDNTIPPEYITPSLNHATLAHHANSTHHATADQASPPTKKTRTDAPPNSVDSLDIGAASTNEISPFFENILVNQLAPMDANDSPFDATLLFADTPFERDWI